MSSRRLALAALLLVTAPPLAGQQADPGHRAEIARLTRTRDSLTVLWQEASALVQLQDSLAHLASLGTLDTVQVHGITVVSNGDQALVRAALEQIWPTYDSVFGDEAVRLGREALVFQFADLDSSKRREFWGAPVAKGVSRDELANLFKGALSIGRGDQALVSWMPGAVPIPYFGLDREATDAYISLVASSPEVGRRCFEGEFTSCAAALRLNDADTAVLLAAWPTARERREVAIKLEAYLREKRNLEGLLECNAGSDAACSYLLRTVAPAALPQPLQPEARQLLVHLALYRGGREAYRRLLSDSTAPMGRRLELASGLPLDSLLVEWRRVVIAHRPAPVSLPAASIVASIASIILLGYFGTRSSRWRLG
jgi:hypothetical protein